MVQGLVGDGGSTKDGMIKFAAAATGWPRGRKRGKHKPCAALIGE